jgi:hypothetical protein
MKKLIRVFTVVGLIVSATGSLFAANWADPFTAGNNSGNPTWVRADMAAALGAADFKVSGGACTITTRHGVPSLFGGTRPVGSYVNAPFTNVRVTAGIRFMNTWTNFVILGRATVAHRGGYILTLDPSGGVAIEVVKTVRGNTAGTILTAGRMADTPVIGTDYNVCLSISGRNIVGKVWKAGTPESGALTLSATDSTYRSGITGLAIFADNGKAPSGTFTGNSDYGDTFASAAIPATAVPEPASLSLLP